MSDERCDLCGQLVDDLVLKPGRCQAGIDWDNGGAHTCDGSRLDASGSELVREAMRAPLLRDALREALDAWDGDIREMFHEYASGDFENYRKTEQARIAELRAKFLEGK